MGARRVWPSEGITRIPYWIYSDPEVYAREQERVFCGPSWSYVALEAELPNAGDFKRTFIGEKPVVVVRDRDGSINVVENRCVHRGVQFCQRHVGNASEFICPYHQWTYDLKGNLIGVPFRRRVKKRAACRRISIRSTCKHLFLRNYLLITERSCCNHTKPWPSPNTILR